MNEHRQPGYLVSANSTTGADLGRIGQLEYSGQHQQLRRQRGNAAAAIAGQVNETLDELTPDDVFARRLAQEELTPELQLALGQRFRAVVTRLTVGTT